MSPDPPQSHPTGAQPTRANLRRPLVAVACLILVVLASVTAIRDPILCRVAILSGFAIILWLSEVVAAHVTTLALVAAIPIVLGGADPAYRIGSVMGWAADPVLALFFGGFALGVAASRHGIDAQIAERTLAFSRNRRRRLLALVMASTALVSMWISNVAAVALILAALRPHLSSGERTQSFRIALLLGVAMAANLGGMATPIGTGPNGIAIAHLEQWTRITFLQWMGMTLPLVIGMLVLTFVLIVKAHRVEGAYQPIDVRAEPLQPRARGLLLVFALAVAAWLSEPLHGISAPVVALSVTVVLFGGGWLRREDLARIDWATLLLIAGGIVLGRLAEHSGVLDVIARSAGGNGMSLTLRITGFVLLAAIMGAVMSNTASTAVLIPLALGLALPRSIAVLIALGSSFGVPFIFSTPPNSMVYGEGGLTPRDLLRVGLPLMIVGALIVGLAGPIVLGWLGIP
jgi:sodium-dependent dicarboxylate transporter 2/3/5